MKVRIIKKIWDSGNLFLSFMAVLTVFIALSGCSDGSTDPGKEDPVPGIYYLYGEKIMNRYTDWPAGPGDVPETDTTGITLIVKVQEVEKESGTYRFYGLDGADVSEEGNHRVFPECTVPELCEVYGKLTGQDLTIEANNEGRSYQAFGSVFQTYEPYMRFEAEYQYQDVNIIYKVEGDQNVDDERFAKGYSKQ